MKDEIESPVVPVCVTVIPDTNGNDQIKCEPNPVPVGDPNTLIAFNLMTPGYHFKSTNTIVLRGTFPDFPYPSWTLNKTTAGLFDLCNDDDVFAYTVKVKRDSDGKEFSVDPEIRNGDAM